MKKLFFTFLAVAFSLAIFAQKDSVIIKKERIIIKDKNTESYLPQAGDFAIGIDASPFINLVGNIIRINDNTGPFYDPSAFNFVDGTSIYGKYFLTNNTAVRAKLSINMSTQTLNNLVDDDSNTTDPNAKVTDTWKNSQNGFGLGLGYELRKGKNRLQAFYGGEVNLNFSGGSKDEYTYGNSMNNNDSIPTTTLSFTSNFAMPVDYRVTNKKTAGGFGFGLRGFVGVEYFIFPKISLGGEFGLGFMYNKVGEGEINSESWNYINHQRDTNKNLIGGSSNFNFSNDNLGGNIFILIHI